jgi:TRAP-type transport system periplasmic protein
VSELCALGLWLVVEQELNTIEHSKTGNNDPVRLQIAPLGFIHREYRFMSIHPLMFLILFVSTGAFSAPKQDRWVIGSVAPLGSIWAKTLQQMQTCASKEIPNGILAAGGSLGGELEIGRKLSQKQIAVASGSAGSWAAIVPELGVFELPGLFQSQAQVDRSLYGSKMSGKINRLSRKQGLHLLMVVENGFREIIGFKKPILKLEDLENIRFRVQQGQIYEDFFSSLKTNPQSLAVTAVPGALSAGRIDAADQTLLYASSANWLSHAKAITQTHHNYQTAFVFASGAWFDLLTPPQKSTLERCAHQAQADGLQAIRAEKVRISQSLKDRGVLVMNPSQELIEGIESASKETRARYLKRAQQSELEFLTEVENSIEAH